MTRASVLFAAWLKAMEIIPGQDAQVVQPANRNLPMALYAIGGGGDEKPIPESAYDLFGIDKKNDVTQKAQPDVPVEVPPSRNQAPQLVNTRKKRWIRRS